MEYRLKSQVVWDTQTGKPLYNAVVWPDTRTKKLVHELRTHDGVDKLHQLSGLPLSTYPSSVKLLWLLRHVHGVRKASEEGRLAFGTVDSWLLYNLTGGVGKGVHVTDPSNASRTMFMNIHTLEYDDFLINWFGVGKVKFPKIVPSSDPEAYGSISNGPLAGVRISGCLGFYSYGPYAFAMVEANMKQFRRPKRRFGGAMCIQTGNGKKHLWNRMLPSL